MGHLIGGGGESTGCCLPPYPSGSNAKAGSNNHGQVKDPTNYFFAKSCFYLAREYVKLKALIAFMSSLNEIHSIKSHYIVKKKSKQSEGNLFCSEQNIAKAKSVFLLRHII
jgi:hypothetical protein